MAKEVQGMAKILTAQATIQGVRPLWWHWFGPDAIALEKGERTGVAGNDPEEWRRTVLATKDGQLFLEPTYVFGCLAGKDGGAKYIKKGRGSILPSVAATLQVLDDRIVLDRWFPGFPNGHAFDPGVAEVPERDPSLPVYLDVRSVVNPSTKGRNVRYRIATPPGWQASFTLQFDKTVVSRGELESALIQAGALVGLGSGRKIGMGRFTVEFFQATGD